MRQNDTFHTHTETQNPQLMTSPVFAIFYIVTGNSNQQPNGSNFIFFSFLAQKCLPMRNQRSNRSKSHRRVSQMEIFAFIE